MIYGIAAIIALCAMFLWSIVAMANTMPGSKSTSYLIPALMMLVATLLAAAQHWSLL